MNFVEKSGRWSWGGALVEGNSVNSTARMCRVSKLTVLRLLADVGRLCREYHDLTVRGLRSKRIQVDEVWSFVGCKEKAHENGAVDHGDAWVLIGMDADSKLVAAYSVGGRDAGNASEFLHDLADRLSERVQLTTDAHKTYLVTVPGAFKNNVDYAMLIKTYGPDGSGNDAEPKYSPGKCNGARREAVIGDPDPEHVSTSFVERQNMTLRMGQRRFTRLTNGYSKRFVNHELAVALHYFHYNFIRRHATLGSTPAQAAGIADREWSLDDLVDLLEKEERLIGNGGRINKTDRT